MALLAISVLASLSIVTTASSQTNDLRTRGWTISCAPNKQAQAFNCQLDYSLVAVKTGEPVIEVTVRGTKQDDATTFDMMISGPHWLHVPSGVNIQIDAGKEHQHPFLSSKPGGLFTVVQLNEKQIKAMKSGQQMHLGFTRLNRTDLTLPISLTGFTAVMTLMRTQIK